jgi:hypothetical protein
MGLDLALIVLLPIALVVGAAVAAYVSVRRSSLRITTAGVEVRNYRQPPRLVPLGEVARFEEPAPVGNFAGVKPKTGVLVLTDGSRIAVRSITEPDAGTGIDALNARLEAVRRAS